MIWTEKNAACLQKATRCWKRIADNSRLLRSQVVARLEKKGYPKLAKKFNLAAEAVAVNRGTRKAIICGVEGKTCAQCKFTFVFDTQVCSHCYETPEGKALMAELKSQKTEITCLAKYGTSRASESKRVQAKMQATNRKRYGVANAMQSPEVRSRHGRSLRRNHGVKNPGQIPGHFNRVIETLRTKHNDVTINGPVNVPGAYDKRLATVTERYGGWTMCSPELRKKVRRTTQERYGENHVGSVQGFVDKRSATTVARYGGFTLRSSILAKRMKVTMLKRYGVAYAMQHPEFLSQALRNSYSVKTATVSGRRVEYQGYELLVLRALEAHFGPKTVATQFEDHGSLVPMISLSDGSKYQPDLYLKPTQVIIEVKSTWTLMRSKKALAKNRLIQKDINARGTKFKFVVVLPRHNRAVTLPPDWHTWSRDKLASLFLE